jgi:quercetin dioxygenase-like cupin family protein
MPGQDRPRILGDAAAVVAGAAPDAAGAVWKLQMQPRDLDANIIRLPAGAGIEPHAGPDLDVLLVVLDGSGQLGTELGPVELRSGALVWLPRRSRRQFTAGPAGLAYLTVHQRRAALVIGAPSGAADAGRPSGP